MAIEDFQKYGKQLGPVSLQDLNSQYWASKQFEKI